MYIFIKELKDDDELIKKVDMPKIIKKMIINIKKIFNIAEVKKIDERHYVAIIPKVNIKVIEKVIRKNNRAKIILSKDLKQYEKELNLIEKNRVTKYFICDILNYIMNKINSKLELQNLYILANEYNEQNLEIIKYLLDKVKTINIVTNNTKKYNLLEEKLYDESGILISVTNNTNKSLRRADFIINLDFESECISKYKINRNAVIINCTNNKINTLKYFEGIIINNIQIALKNSDKIKLVYNEFDKIDIYDAFEIENTKYIENVSKIAQNKVKIVNVLGNNGIINTKEILNIQKNIDKSKKVD